MKKVLFTLSLLMALAVPAVVAAAQERIERADSALVAVESTATFGVRAIKASYTPVTVPALEVHTTSRAPATELDADAIAKLILGMSMALPFLIGMAGSNVTLSLSDRAVMGDELRQQHNKLVDDVELVRKQISEFVGSATYDPASLVDGARATTTITVTGAALGDFVTGVSFSLDLQGVLLLAYVSAVDTVTVVFQNESGGTVDLASGTIRVMVASHSLADAAGDLTAAKVVL